MTDSEPAVTQSEIGPRTPPGRPTCTGCPALVTKYWKDYLDNDETDSGTSARCSAVPDEHGGKSITAYWAADSAPPSWCPARHRHASEERERVLREALANTKHWLTQLQPALNVMSRDILADIIADHIDPALAPETPND